MRPSPLWRNFIKYTQAVKLKISNEMNFSVYSAEVKEPERDKEWNAKARWFFGLTANSYAILWTQWTATMFALFFPSHEENENYNSTTNWVGCITVEVFTRKFFQLDAVCVPWAVSLAVGWSVHIVVVHMGFWKRKFTYCCAHGRQWRKKWIIQLHKIRFSVRIGVCFCVLAIRTVAIDMFQVFACNYWNNGLLLQTVRSIYFLLTTNPTRILRANDHSRLDDIDCFEDRTMFKSFLYLYWLTRTFVMLHAFYYSCAQIESNVFRKVT